MNFGAPPFKMNTFLLRIIILGASLIYRLENMLSFVNEFSSTNFMLTVLLNDANRD